MKNLWEVWPDAISNAKCDEIIQRCIDIPERRATIGFDNASITDAYRSSRIKWLDVDFEHHDIAEMMMFYVKKSNRNNFGFDITYMNEIQYTEYLAAENGHYDWHHDVDFENEKPYDRKLSVVIQLSDENSYTGGSFEFFGISSPGDLFARRGSVIVFPSFFYHKVNPVISGKRNSLVSWVEGPKFR